MGFKDFIAKIKNFGKGEEFKTLISLGPNKERFSYATYEKPNYEKLENAYRDFSVFSSINLFSASVYGSGFSLKGKDKVLELCEPVQHISSFKPSCIDGIKNALVYGNGFNEILWEDNFPIGFKVVDTKTLEPKWDERGNILSYVQTPPDGNPISVDKEDIIFFRFFRSSDNVHGIGFIEPILRLLEIRNEMIEALGDIFKYLAFPPIHVVKEGAKSKRELKSAEKSLKNFRRKDYFVTSEKFKINLLEVKRNLPDLTKNLDMINDYISAGLRVPHEFLSGRATYVTKAASIALKEYSKDEIQYIREKLAAILEEQLFKPICLKNGIPEKDVPRVFWKPDETIDPKTSSEVLLNKMKSIGTAIDLDVLDRSEAKEKILSLLDKI